MINQDKSRWSPWPLACWVSFWRWWRHLGTATRPAWKSSPIISDPPRTVADQWPWFRLVKYSERMWNIVTYSNLPSDYPSYTLMSYHDLSWDGIPSDLVFHRTDPNESQNRDTPHELWKWWCTIGFGGYHGILDVWNANNCLAGQDRICCLDKITLNSLASSSSFRARHAKRRLRFFGPEAIMSNTPQQSSTQFSIRE